MRRFSAWTAWTVLLSSGCTAIHHIEIVSDPPGARVEVDGDYVGDTPLVYALESPLAERVWPDETIVRAYPRDLQGDLFIQTKRYSQYSPLPGRILFLLELPPPGWRPEPQPQPQPVPEGVTGSLDYSPAQSRE